MANRNSDRNRGRSQRPDNWDWYYYEYDYTPGRGATYYDWNYDPYYDRYYYNAPYSRNYNGPYFRNRDYDRDFDFTSATSYPHGYGDYSGQYAGYGPSGYTRSDDRIADDINDHLTWDPRIDASDITVSVNDGMVTLTGSVDSRRDKRIAEDIVDNVWGVWDVNNQLRVRNRGYYRGQRSGAQRGQLTPGMEVVDRNGLHVGTVKDVRDYDFLLERPNAPDLFVPFGECHVENNQVKLDALSSELDNQGSMQPEMQRSQQKKR